MPVTHVNKVRQGRPHIVDKLKNGEVAFIVNTTEGGKAIADSQLIRTTALQRGVPYATTMAAARATVLALREQDNIAVFQLQALHAGLQSGSATDVQA